MHFVIAIMLRCFVVVDVDNARYLTSELEKINVEERQNVHLINLNQMNL